jgi:hypothetical protein
MDPNETPEGDLMDESDASLLAAAESIFADDLVSSQPEELDLKGVPAIDDEKKLKDTTEKPDFGRPGIGDMITVKGGGLYLPVRKRVIWMRGEPVPHPDRTIDTIPEKVVEGTLKGAKVEGGYARYRANVFDANGRLISTGTKTEYSERFMDFVEKAETGAIGRALAVAGYGTEAAVDLDEGLEKERIADAPVMPAGRPINITPSAIPGVKPGGRPAKITNTQIGDIARLNKQLGLGYGLVMMMEGVKGEKMPALEAGHENEQMRAFLETFTHDEAGLLIQQLNSARTTEGEL